MSRKACPARVAKLAILCGIVWGATEAKRDYNGNDLMPKKEKFNPKIRKLCPPN